MKSNSPSLMEMMISMTRVSRAYKNVCDRFASAYGLTAAIAWPIVAISRLGDNTRPSEVARAVGLEPSSLVRLIDKLEEAGFLVRKDDATDRRARPLYLTEKGHDTAGRLDRDMVPLRAELLQNISLEDLETCKRVFETLGANIDKHLAGK